MKRKEIRLYNVLFPVWMLMLFPQTWLVILPGNFLIDSAVLLLGMAFLKIGDKKQYYKKHILWVYAFGLLSDIIGAAYMFCLVYFFEVGTMGDELYLILPALIISAALIFVFNCFVTFRSTSKSLRFKMSLLFAAATAPYTFLVPSAWIY